MGGMASSHSSLTEEAIHEGMQLRQQFDDKNRIVATVRMMGGALVTLLLVGVVLNEIFTSVNIGSGPFSELGTDIQNTGATALGLLVIGLLVVAANRIIGIFGGGGGM